MRKLILLLLFFIPAMAYSQTCVPYTENWTGSGALGSPWSTPISTGAPDTLTKSSGTVVDTGGSGGIAILNGCGAFTGNQVIKATVNGIGNYTGISITDTSGNGYFWTWNLNQIQKMTAGSGTGVTITGCTAVSTGDVVYLFRNGSTNQLTCYNSTTGVTNSGTDGTYTSGLYPGVFVWNGFPLGPVVVDNTIPTVPLSQPVIAYSTGVFLNTDGTTNNFLSIGSTPTFQRAENVQLITDNIQPVIINGATPHVVCWRKDGGTPTATTPGTCDPGSTTAIYGSSSTISITGTTTIKAINTCASCGLANSGVNTTTINISPFYPAPWTYAYNVVVTMTGIDGGNIIYTTNGSTPTANGSCVAINGIAVSNGFQLTLSATTTINAITCKGGTTNTLSGSPATYTIRTRNTWYIRSDGGTRYDSTLNPTGQCNGLTNVAYPGSGTNQPCGFKQLKYLWDTGTLTNGLGTWIIAGGDKVIISDCATDSNDNDPQSGMCRVGWQQGGGGGPTNPWCPNIGGQGCTNPTPIPVGINSQPTEFDGVNYTTCATGGNNYPSKYNNQLAQIFGGFGLQFTLDLRDTQYVTFNCIGVQSVNGGTATFTGNISNGSTSITSVVVTSGTLHIGDAIEVPGTITPIPAKTHITNISGSTITTDLAAVASATGITITDLHACTRIGDIGWPRLCNSSDDYADNAFHTNRNTIATFNDTYIHSFNNGLFGPFWQLYFNRASINFNSQAADQPDDGASTPDGPSGILSATYAETIGNGCQMEWPIVHGFPALQCLATSHAGFGDAWSGQDTLLNTFSCIHCIIAYNMKDGTIGPHPLANLIDIEYSTIYDNMGSGIKFISATGGTVKFLNNFIYGSCLRITDTANNIPGAPQSYWDTTGLNGAYMKNGDACRAGGDTFAANLQANANWTIGNNTFAEHPFEHMAFNCGIAYIIFQTGHSAANCNTATLNIINNIFLGYTTTANSAPPILDTTSEQFGFYSITPTFSHNISLGNGASTPNAFPSGTNGNVTTDPQLVNEPIQQTWTNQAFTDNMNINLTSGSPAILTGVSYTGMNTLDYNNISQTSPPTIGAVIFSSGPPPSSPGPIVISGGTGTIVIQGTGVIVIAP